MTARVSNAAIELLVGWLGERYFRTFRREPAAETRFDALLSQREHRIGVTVGTLWEGGLVTGAEEWEALLASELEDEPGGRALWVPPGAALPDHEPRRSELRLLLSNGMRGLEPGARREVRIPVTAGLARVGDEGAYMSVVGGLATEWTTLSEGINGAFHLDSRELRRLPEQRAEVEILVSRVRDHAAALASNEVTPIQLHDYWVVSRLPADEPAGVTVIGAPPDFDQQDGAVARRLLRRHVTRAVEQRQAASEAGEQTSLAVLVLVAALAHLQDEMATAALRGMNPAAYGALDLIALVADGAVRQVLQPRSLPWEQR